MMHLTCPAWTLLPQTLHHLQESLHVPQAQVLSQVDLTMQSCCSTCISTRNRCEVKRGSKCDHGVCSVCLAFHYSQSSAFGCIDTVTGIKYYIYYCIFLGKAFSLLIFILMSHQNSGKLFDWVSYVSTSQLKYLNYALFSIQNSPEKATSNRQFPVLIHWTLHGDRLAWDLQLKENGDAHSRFCTNYESL